MCEPKATSINCTTIFNAQSHAVRLTARSIHYVVFFRHEDCVVLPELICGEKGYIRVLQTF